MKSFPPFLIFVIFIFGMGCARDVRQPGYEIKMLTDMVYPVPYEAYTKTDAAIGAQGMLTPALGSVPRGFQPFPYGVGVAEAIRAGVELTNPVVSNAVNLERGQERYTIYCQVCHGTGGQGDGPLIPKFPNPPSLTSKRVREFPDGRIVHVITRGGSGGIMASHATQISLEDRWKIVLYIRSLQERK